MLVLSDDFRASKIMVDRVLRTQNITVEYNTTLDEILGSDTTVESVRLLNTKTDIIYDIKVDGVFIAIGHTPNTKIFEGQIELSSGYVVTDSISTKTNISGVFAAGDVADPIYRQAITSAGSGCKAAIDAEKYIGSLEII
jgi:thioredoxin reductase (NADPH)